MFPTYQKIFKILSKIKSIVSNRYLYHKSFESKIQVDYINKRPLGHIAHLRYSSNQWKHLQKVIIMVIPLREDILLFLELNGPYVQNLNFLHPRMLCAMFGWNWLSGSWGKKIVDVFSIFRYYLPLKIIKGGFFVWTNFNSLHKSMVVPSLVEIGLVVLEKNIHSFRQCIFDFS